LSSGISSWRSFFHRSEPGPPATPVSSRTGADRQRWEPVAARTGAARWWTQRSARPVADFRPEARAFPTPAGSRAPAASPAGRARSSSSRAASGRISGPPASPAAPVPAPPTWAPAVTSPPAPAASRRLAVGVPENSSAPARPAFPTPARRPGLAPAALSRTTRWSASSPLLPAATPSPDRPGRRWPAARMRAWCRRASPPGAGSRPATGPADSRSEPRACGMRRRPGARPAAASADRPPSPSSPSAAPPAV